MGVKLLSALKTHKMICKLSLVRNHLLPTITTLNLADFHADCNPLVRVPLDPTVQTSSGSSIDSATFLMLQERWGDQSRLARRDLVSGSSAT